MSSVKRGTFARREPAQCHSLDEPLSVNPVWETTRTNALTSAGPTSVARAASAVREVSVLGGMKSTTSTDLCSPSGSVVRDTRPVERVNTVQSRGGVPLRKALNDGTRQPLSDDDEQPRLCPAAGEVPVRTLNFIAPESLRPSASRSPPVDARERLVADVGSVKPQATLDDSTPDALDGDTTSALSEEQGVDGFGGDYPASPSVVVSSALRYMVEPFPANREPVELSLESSWHDDFEEVESLKVPLHDDSHLQVENRLRGGEHSPGSPAAAAAAVTLFSRSQPRRTALDLVSPAPVIERSPRPHRVFSVDDEGEISSLHPSGYTELLVPNLPRKTFPSPLQLIERSCRELPVGPPVVSSQPFGGLFCSASAVRSRNASPADHFDQPRGELPVKPHPRPTPAAQALHVTVEQFLENTAKLLGRGSPEGQLGSSSLPQQRRHTALNGGVAVTNPTHPRVVASGPALGKMGSVRASAAVASHAATTAPSTGGALVSHTGASPKPSPRGGGSRGSLSPLRTTRNTGQPSDSILHGTVRTAESDRRSPALVDASVTARTLSQAAETPAHAINVSSGEERSDGEARGSATSPLEPRRGDAPRIVGRRSLRDRVLEKKHKMMAELSTSAERRSGTSAPRLEHDDRSDRSLGSFRASPRLEPKRGDDAAALHHHNSSTNADLRSQYVTAKRTNSNGKRQPPPLHPKSKSSASLQGESKLDASRNSSTPLELVTLSSSVGSRAPTPLEISTGTPTNNVGVAPVAKSPVTPVMGSSTAAAAVHTPSRTPHGSGGAATLDSAPSTPRVATKGLSNESPAIVATPPVAEIKNAGAMDANEEGSLRFVSSGSGSVPRDRSVASGTQAHLDTAARVIADGDDTASAAVVREPSLSRYQSVGRLSVARPAAASPSHSNTPLQNSHSPSEPVRRSEAQGDDGRTSSAATRAVASPLESHREENTQNEPQPKQRDVIEEPLLVAPPSACPAPRSAEFRTSGTLRIEREPSLGPSSCHPVDSGLATKPRDDDATTIEFSASGRQRIGRPSYRSAGNLIVLRRSSSVASESLPLRQPSTDNATTADPVPREEPLPVAARDSTTPNLMFHSSGHQALGREKSYRSGGNLSVLRRSSSTLATERKVQVPHVSTPPPPREEEVTTQEAGAPSAVTDAAPMAVASSSRGSVTATTKPTTVTAKGSRRPNTTDVELQAKTGPPPPRVRPRLRHILGDNAL